jgi:hypothetical protein
VLEKSSTDSSPDSAERLDKNLTSPYKGLINKEPTTVPSNTKQCYEPPVISTPTGRKSPSSGDHTPALANQDLVDASRCAVKPAAPSGTGAPGGGGISSVVGGENGDAVSGAGLGSGKSPAFVGVEKVPEKLEPDQEF